MTSATRRLSRLLDNPAIRVREWYEPIAREWLQAQFQTPGEIRLIVDGTKIGLGHQLLIVCLSYRKRAIPIAWTWVKQVRGHSTARKQLALFRVRLITFIMSHRGVPLLSKKGILWFYGWLYTAAR